MSIVDDQIRRLDVTLDRFQVAAAASSKASVAEQQAEELGHDKGHKDGPRDTQLKSVSDIVFLDAC